MVVAISPRPKKVLESRTIYTYNLPGASLAPLPADAKWHTIEAPKTLATTSKYTSALSPFKTHQFQCKQILTSILQTPNIQIARKNERITLQTLLNTKKLRSQSRSQPAEQCRNCNHKEISDLHLQTNHQLALT
jgi:hypothetical protein